jgi:hypothetical protein
MFFELSNFPFLEIRISGFVFRSVFLLVFVFLKFDLFESQGFSFFVRCDYTF